MFEFGNFTPQSFEKFIQSLCAIKLGSGIVVFGSGPDGAREATFSGKINFPSALDEWNGYVVVQAKHREKPNNSGADTSWLVAQIKGEFDKFLDKKRALKKPEYYIIATNISLSAVARSGGKDRIEALFKKYQSVLGLKGWHIWAAEELEALLNSLPELRTSFAAWVTPSDVLAQLLQNLKRPNLSRLLPLALARDLRNDRDVRLRDAGQETEKSIFLDSVFVDLPIETSLRSRFSVIEDDADEDLKVNQAEFLGIEEEVVEDDNEDDGDGEATLGVVAALLTRAADKLDPDACNQQKHAPRRNRIVILGGPGQGKSTIGQFVVQLCRAKLLQSNNRGCLNPQTEEIIKPVLDRARAERLPLAGPNRFPIRLDLPAYSDLLASHEQNGETFSVAAYTAQRLSKDVDSAIDVDDLRAWLRTCPCLIIFDGLDEVPPSGNRKSVISAIEAFWDEIHLAKADVLVVVTSRPQGYNASLNDRHWEHWQMAPLSPKQAIRFAECLSLVRLSEVDRRELVLSEISRAVHDPATKLLATSPLQVTILFGIALLRGAIPQDRWDLFEKYYTLLRDREAQKSGPDATLFREFKRQIDALHHEAGFLLQVSAETSGGATAFLTPIALENLIRAHLEADGYEPAKIDRVVAELSHVATERLVLLSSRVEGRISFDVRSLQEFMAATRITSAGPVPLQERLRAIATSAHWRNVYRIAASRIFSVADLNILRSDVIGICHALDSGDWGEDERAVKAGASLALDLLADGIADSTPKFKKSLLRRALTLLDVETYTPDHRFLELFDDDTAEIFKEEILLRLEKGELPGVNTALRLACGFLQLKQAWAEEFILKHFPKDPKAALAVFQSGDPYVWSEKIIEKILQAQAEAGPDRALQFQGRWSFSMMEDERLGSILKRITVFPEAYRRPSKPILFPVLGPDSSLAGRITRFNDKNFIIDGDSVLHSQKWPHLLAVSDYVKNPNRETLIYALEKFALGRELPGLPRWRFPWPLHSILLEIAEGADLQQLIDEARDGRFGDVTDWEEAEKRLETFGVTEEDFLSWQQNRYLGSNIRTVGAPPFLAASRHVRKGSQFPLKQLTQLAKGMVPRGKKLRLIEMVARGIVAQQEIPDRDSIEFVLSAIKDSQPTEIASILVQLSKSASMWTYEKFLSLIQKSLTERASSTLGLQLPPQEVLEKIDFVERWRGLLPVVAGSIMQETSVKGELQWMRGAALAVRSNDSAPVLRAIILLKFMAGQLASEDVGLASDYLADRFVAPPLLSEVLEGYSESLRSKLLHLIIGSARKKGSNFSPLYLSILRTEVESRPSPFADDEELRRLALPFPNKESATTPGQFS